MGFAWDTPNVVATIGDNSRLSDAFRAADVDGDGKVNPKVGSRGGNLRI